ncbi:hypothetical protein FB567DRAFT_512898 [Paraphoma chrysanthemicola]|uniref:DUF7730 domain-containing protein n=1 Tax=Paraphoma chrysanthemicola TaxID=798071 RepID=A0A8K0W5U4_9PLEO|nr:hypothetical protein FB567DRAFT_512898 [Paraphoma chrysanthemicola]
MDAAGQHPPTQPSRLLKLPRELRDIIYAYVFDREVISIESAVTKVVYSHTSSRPRTYLTNDRAPSYANELRKEYPLRAATLHRRIGSVPAFDVGFDSYGTPNTVYMTYQLAKDVQEDGVSVALLQVCKQANIEASSVFYGRSTFSFTSDFRIPCAFAFLCDRPASSLLQIRSLELALMEYCNMAGTSQAHFPVIRRSTDCLVLQYAYQYFTELCTLLSTPRVHLRELYLTVETTGRRISDSPTTLEEILDYEKRTTHMCSHGVPSWLDPLLNIKDIEFIRVCWISNQPRAQRMTEAVTLMREHMIFKSTPDKTSSQHTEYEDRILPLRFRMVRYDDRPSWSDWMHVILKDEDFAEEGEQACESCMTNKQHWVPNHIRKALEEYSRAYICCCQLNSV